MNVCTGIKKEYIRGHLYSGTTVEVALYHKYRDEMIDLKTGLTYNLAPSHNWIDVTDQYCLQKVK